MLRAAPNQRATLVTPVEPWALKLDLPAFADKAAFGQWASDPATNYCFFSASEGLNPAIRVSKTNGLKILHGLVADFDANIVPAMEQNVTSVVEFRPNWMSKTFSNGRRLVWLFDQPIALSGNIVKPFLSIARDQLKLKKLLPGYDEPAWFDLGKLYALGDTWTCVSETPISSAALHHWLFEASKKTKWDTDIKIPLDAVADEVEKLFPGRWQGPFEEGRRGVVFFNPSSVNPSAAVVRDNGLVTFGEEKNFWSWAELFPSLARKFTQDKIGHAIESVWWDGRSYFCRDNEQWWTHTTETVRRALMVDHGLDISRGKHETCSEVDRALRFIEKQRRVAGAVPIVFNPNDIVYLNGQKFLNTSHVKPMQPADEPQEYAERFSWLAGFLEARFLPEELPYLLAWFQRTYTGALAGNPMRCQALFLVGGKDLGKTLFSNKIVGAALGGFADASSHIAKGDQFNRELGETGLLCIDDGEVASTPDAHRRFTEAVKKVVANPVFTWRAMRRDPQTIPLNAKLIVTLNDDAFSVQMIPDLSLTTEDKLMVLKFHDAPFAFQANHIQEPIIASELPFFLRWLSDWTPPAHVVGGARLGVVSYINEDLRAKALHSSGVGDVLELTGIFMKSVPPEEDGWSGTASDFYSAAVSFTTTEPLVRKYSPRVLGRRFSEASRIADSGISLLVENKKKGNRFKIAHPEREHRTVRVTPEVEVAA